MSRPMSVSKSKVAASRLRASEAKRARSLLISVDSSGANRVAISVLSARTNFASRSRIALPLKARRRPMAARRDVAQDARSLAQLGAAFLSMSVRVLLMKPDLDDRRGSGSFDGWAV